MDSAGKILIINLGGIGDLFLSTPALKALRNTYSKAHICLLVAPRIFEFAKDLTFIDEVFVFYFSYRVDKTFKNLKTLLALRKKQFDLAINLRTLVSRRSALKMRLLLDFISPKIRAGRDTEGRGQFFDIKIPETTRGQKYEMDYDMEMVRAFGIEVKNRDIDFTIDDAAFKRVSQILENKGASRDDILIGIHPGGRPSRRWPIENFAEVIEKIQETIACKFVITGEEAEIDLSRQLTKMINSKVIDLVGKLSLKELGAFIKICGLFITNDTGPMHIAAVFNTALIAIFGPENLKRYDPRNLSEGAIVFYKKIDCSPCNKVTCKSMKCLKAVSPEEVAKAALELLKRNENKRIDYARQNL